MREKMARYELGIEALSLTEPTDAEKQRARQVVCGSPHTRDAADAATLLEALGLKEHSTKEN